MTERTPRAAAAIAAMKAGATYDEAQAAYLAAPRGPRTPEEEAAVAAGRAPLGFIPVKMVGRDRQVGTFTVSAEVAAQMMAKEVKGVSIREEPVPAPVPAAEHAMFRESRRFPGVVWPL